MKSLMDHPGYSEAKRKLDSLKAEQADAQRRYADILRGLQKSGETLQEQAVRYLAGEPEPTLTREKLRYS